MDRLAALDIFVRVVDAGSFSAVARQLRVGQPAVSKAVVQLERWSAALAGKLRVSTSPCFGRIDVVPHLPAFLAAHPELSIDLVLDDRVIDLVEEGSPSPSAAARRRTPG